MRKTRPTPWAQRTRLHPAAGFTLLELMTGLVILAILAVMVIEGSQGMLSKAERANCASNLRTLYVGASAHVADQQQWPQISGLKVSSPEYAGAWVNALKRYGISAKNWICPSVQRQMKFPDYSKPSNMRIDYFATPFEGTQRAPYRWAMQPWFMERADMHGDGQLIIFTNSEMKSVGEVRKTQGRIDLDSW